MSPKCGHFYCVVTEFILFLDRRPDSALTFHSTCPHVFYARIAAMDRSIAWIRKTLHQRGMPIHSSRTTRRLTFDILEDRIAPTVTPADDLYWVTPGAPYISRGPPLGHASYHGVRLGRRAFNELEALSEAVKYETGEPSDVKTAPQQDSAVPIEDALFRDAASASAFGFSQVQFRRPDFSDWVVPSRESEFRWTNKDGTGDDWYERPAREESESLLLGHWRGLAFLDSVKEQDPKDSFWEVRDPFAAAEGFSWHG